MISMKTLDKLLTASHHWSFRKLDKEEYSHQSLVEESQFSSNDDRSDSPSDGSSTVDYIYVRKNNVDDNAESLSGTDDELFTIPAGELNDHARNRAFAMFETVMYRYHMARKSKSSDLSTHDKIAETLVDCVDSQVKNKLETKIEESTETGRPFHITPTSDFVEKFTVLNMSMEEAEITEQRENMTSKFAVQGRSDRNCELNEEKEIRQSLSNLHRHLKKLHTTSDCPHKVMLQMDGFQVTWNDDEATAGPFKLLMSPCSNPQGSDSPMWQEARCKIQRNTQLDSVEAGNETMCSLVSFFKSHRKVASMVFNEKSLCLDVNGNELKYPLAESRTSLRDLLDRQRFSNPTGKNSSVYSSTDKTLLILNVARSLFHLFNGPWGPCSWKADDIVFPSNTTKVHGRHVPYVRWELQDTTEKLKGVLKPKSQHLMYPMWVALAKLLLEIHIGKSVVTEGTDDDREQLKSITAAELANIENRSLREAIECCLDLGMILLNVSPEDIEQKEREIIRNKIIAKLEENHDRWNHGHTINADLIMSPADYPDTKIPGFEDPTSVQAVQPQASSAQREQDSAMASLRPGRRTIVGLSSFILYDEQHYDNGDVKSGEKFFQHMRDFTEGYINPIKRLPEAPWHSHRIKIAVLDSGVSGDDKVIRRALGKRIKGWSPTGTETQDFHDSYGHGTHVTRLLLELAPLADIYVAKVSEGKYLDETKLCDIVNAIEWALDTVNVDIFTLSLGMQKDIPEISQAIRRALSRGKLVFAAAANEGGLHPRAFPARIPGVICIHASDGLGKAANFSPWPQSDTDNFSTIGTGIESKWKGNSVVKAGTSFATPIAAAMASNILEFARTHLNEVDDKTKSLYRYPSMRKLLRSMAKTSHEGYHFIKPWNLFRRIESEDSVAVRKARADVSCELQEFLYTHHAPKSWSA